MPTRPGSKCLCGLQVWVVMGIIARIIPLVCGHATGFRDTVGVMHVGFGMMSRHVMSRYVMSHGVLRRGVLQVLTGTRDGWHSGKHENCKSGAGDEAKHG